MTTDLILLLSVLADGLAVLIDKRATRSASAWDCAVFGILFQAALLVPFFGLWQAPPFGTLLLLIGMGLLTGSARVMWYKGLHGEKLTRVAPFRRLSSVFALAFALIGLGEGRDLATHVIVGSLIMVAGSLMILFDKLSRSLPEFLKANRYVGCVLYFAASLALLKAVNRHLFVTEGINVFTAYFTVKMGQVLLVLPALRRPHSLGGAGPLALSQGLQMAGALAYFVALSRQSLILSESVAAASPLVLVFLGRYWLKEVDPLFKWRLLAGAVMLLGYLVMRGVLV